MLALTAAGSYGSADDPMRITPETPAALAVRMIVPTLPGLAGSWSAANRPPWHGQVLYGGGRAAHDRGQPGGTISVGDPSEQLPGQSRHPDSDRLLRVHHVQGAAVTQQFWRDQQHLDAGAGLHGLPYGLDAVHHERRLPPPVFPVS